MKPKNIIFNKINLNVINSVNTLDLDLFIVTDEFVKKVYTQIRGIHRNPLNRFCPV